MNFHAYVVPQFRHLFLKTILFGSIFFVTLCRPGRSLVPLFTPREPGTRGGLYVINISKDKVKFCLLNGTEPTYFEVDLSTQDENTSSDPWPKSQETQAATCNKNEVSFCPPVAAANIQGMFDYSLVSIAEDASTLSDVANES